MPPTEIPDALQKAIQWGRTDPIYFIEELLGIALHEGQKRYIREWLARGTRTNILSCANRFGKSVLISCLQLWHLYYKIGIKSGGETWFKTEYRTANIAPHSALTEPVFKTMHQIMTDAFPVLRDEDGKITAVWTERTTLSTNECKIKWFYLKKRTINQPPYKQYFAFNCYIEHRSLGADQGDALQGKPYGVITYDEAARSAHLEDELGDAIKPRLMDWGGTLHLLSTPSQDSPSTIYYYQIYQEGLVGVNNTYTQTGAIWENTTFAKSQIQAQIAMFENDPLKDQILEGKFVFGGATLFNGTDLINAQDESLNEGERYEEGHKYAIGTDTAIGSDEFSVMVLDCTTRPYRLVRDQSVKGNSKSPQMHLNDFIDLTESYFKENNIRHLLETWNGESVRFYKDLPPWIVSFTTCYGAWRPERNRSDNKNSMAPKTTNIKKADLLVNLKTLLADGDIKIPKNDQKLIQQLSMYKEDDKKLPQDRVISLALAAYAAEQMQQTQEVVWEDITW